MTVTGVVVEYNPLHNGHVYHIKKAREITNCDYVIGVMSGNFVQRGEPSVINKWSRAKAAILAGIDLVVELPFLYSTSSAENFAYGAVSILNSIGVTDNICFGSETDNIDTLKYLQKIISSPYFNEILHENIKTGISYPLAIQKTLTKYIIAKNSQYVNVFNYIFNSNDILSIEYINSLNKLKSSIKPYTIKRISNNYNDTNISGKYSSANSIRKNLESCDIVYTMPDFSYKILKDDIKNGIGPVTIENFKDLIFYNLRIRDIEYIKNLPEVKEGLEYKIKSMSDNYTTVDELIKSIKSKRYTYARIQRILLYSILGISKADYSIIKNGPKYVRVLGFNNNGRKILKNIKKNCNLPIITNPSPKDFELLKYDILSTDLYVLGYKNNKFKRSKQDFLIPPVYINS